MDEYQNRQLLPGLPVLRQEQVEPLPYILRTGVREIELGFD